MVERSTHCSTCLPTRGSIKHALWAPPAGLVITVVRGKQESIAEEVRDWQIGNRGSFLGIAQLYPLGHVIFLELAAIGLDLSDETGPF